MLFFVLATLASRRRGGASSSLSEREDRELMLLYADQGDQQAFAVLLQRHQRGVLNFIYRSVGDRDRAEEITQDVFMKVVRTADRYKPTAKFTTWLYTIARNACIDEARRRSRRRTMSLDEPVSSDGDEGRTFVDRLVDTQATAGAASLSRQRFIERLQQALLELPAEQREVFVLRHYNGLKFREIAEAAGLSDNTVKSRMRYALQALRGLLQDFEGLSFDELEQEMVGAKDAPEPV